MAEPQQTPPTALYRRRWFRRSLVAFAVLVIVLSLLPVAIRYAAIHVLQDQGIQHVEIADVDLNLFTGEVGLTDVGISGDGLGRATLSRLYVNLAISALFSKRLALQQLELQGLELDVQQTETGVWQVAGISPPTPAQTTASEVEQPPAEPWGIAVDQLKLVGISVHLSMPQLQSDVRIDELRLSQLASWQPQQAAHYEAQLHIDQAPLMLSGTMQPFADTPQFAGKLELTQLPLALAAEFARDAGIENLSGELAISTEFRARILAGMPAVETTSELALTALTLQQGQYRMQAQRLAWRGQVNYLPPADEQDLGLRADGTLMLQRFVLGDEQAGLQLVQLQQLDVDTMVLGEAQQLSIKHIAFDQLELLQKGEQRLLKTAAISVTDVSFDGQQHLAIKDVVLNGLAVHAVLSADGEVELVSQLQASGATQAQDPGSETVAATAQDEVPPFRFELARLHVADDSRLHFKDNSIDPAFEADIKPFSLTIAHVDTAALDQAMEVDLRGVINGQDQITLDASLRPFGDTLDLQAEGKITALDLPPLSPYANQAMGYYLKRGQLNSSLTASIEADQLDANIHVVLQKFAIEEGDPSKHKGFSDRLSMPLDAALSLLRDKHGTIELDIPVQGDISDPQFDVSQVINKALAKATKTAVTGYLALMLQPWGAMLIAADMLSDAGSVSLQPLVFPPGETGLGREQQDYLVKIAALMQQRPEISLNICGVASQQDRQALLALRQQSEQGQASSSDNTPPADEAIDNQQLLDLAMQRARQVKAQLIERGIEAGRLFTCQPDMQNAASNAPLVKLFL